MAVEVTMPKFGLTMHEGTIQRFFKAVGESISAGDPLYEVETEKVLYEVESPASGVFAVALFEEGATVECGVAVAVIAEAGDDPAVVRAKYGERARRFLEWRGESASKRQPLTAIEAKSTSGERRPVSPVARKLAAELGRESRSRDGQRTRRKNHARGCRARREIAASAVAAAAQCRPHIPLRGMRKTIAERMHQSLRDTAQLTITSEADVTPATELRERLKREFDFTYTDLLIQAAGRALAEASADECAPRGKSHR